MAAELPADIITLPEDSNGTVQYKQAEHSISSECLQMPVREFMDSTWHLLGIYLDGTNESRTGLGVAKDWRGLAELTNIAPSVSPFVNCTDTLQLNPWSSEPY